MTRNKIKIEFKIKLKIKQMLNCDSFSFKFILLVQFWTLYEQELIKQEVKETHTK